MKYFGVTLLFTLFLTKSFALDIDFSNFSLIPIIHEGRVKPLASVAKAKLKEIRGSSSIDTLNETQWFAELIFNPKKSYEREVFKIVNNDVKNALFLDKDKKYFSFIELYKSFSKNQKLISDITSKEEKELDLSASQIKELYNKFSDFMAISRSFSFLIPELKIDSSHTLSYFDLLKSNLPLKQSKVVNDFKDYLKEDAQFSTPLIIPTQSQDGVLWITPWNALLGNQIDKLTLWQNLYKSYVFGDESFSSFALNLQDRTLLPKFKAEIFLNHYDLDKLSLSFYVLVFLVLSLFFLFSKRYFYYLSLIGLFFGFFIHCILISLRCFILSRPPVTNLYESILFVGLTGVFISLWYELKRKNSLGLFIGSILGSVMLFLSFGYQKTGDNLSMVVAVLDTNFWLATHVLTISIGYGCALVSSLLAHFYLFKFNQSRKDENEILEKNLHGTVLYSLFFTTLGTILGGIWADQSWGRFWGWDPKENGALLICLWLLWITHGKIAGKFKHLTFAFFTALTSIVVTMAWFGVNLLNVGLHSYGFSSDTAYSLLIFSILEISIACALLIKAKKTKLQH